MKAGPVLASFPLRACHPVRTIGSPTRGSQIKDKQGKEYEAKRNHRFLFRLLRLMSEQYGYTFQITGGFFFCPGVQLMGDVREG
jgi:hypothetical protein